MTAFDALVRTFDLTPGQLARLHAAWDESKHPRHPPGSDKGGEFAPQGSGESAASNDDVELAHAFRRKGIFAEDDRAYDDHELRGLKPLIAAQRAYESLHGINGLRVDHAEDLNSPAWSDERIASTVSRGKMPLYAQAREYTVKDSPPLIPLRYPKHCYQNAYTVAKRNPERFAYVEGTMFTPGLPIPVEHAWVVDKKDGRVIDPTLGYIKNGRYFGVEYNVSDVTAHRVKEQVAAMHYDGRGRYIAPHQNAPVQNTPGGLLDRFTGRNAA